jgi:large subunit ribosomal protein L22
MEVKAVTKYARISAAKARDFARHIRGLPVGAALDLLEFSPQKGARLIRKTLKSAVANAENNNGLNPAILFVKEAAVDMGPSMKRFQPAARGSASPILKRMSHIKVTVAEREETVARPVKKTRKASTAARQPRDSKARAEKSE